MTATRAHRYFMLTFVPILTVAVAFFLSKYIPALRSKATLFIFLGAVMVSAWYGGLFSGLLATLFAAFVTALLIIQPTNSVIIGDADELLRWVLFVLVALMISSLHASRGRAEAALRQSEQRLLLAVDAAHIGIWDYNLIKRQFWWSKTLEVIYDRTDGSFPNTYGQFFGCIHFDDQPLFNRAITRTIDEGTDYEIEHRIVLPNKTARWVNTRGRVFFNELSRAERIVGVTTDITQRRKAEDDRKSFMSSTAEPNDELSRAV